MWDFPFDERISYSMRIYHHDFPLGKHTTINTNRNFETTLPTDEHKMIHTYRNFKILFPIDEDTMLYTLELPNDLSIDEYVKVCKHCNM